MSGFDPEASFAMTQATQVSPQEQVHTAMMALHRTLLRHELFEAHPDIAHDYVVLQEALAVLEGDNVAVQYWRARKTRLLTTHPDLKKRQHAQKPQVVVRAVRCSYLRQETKHG